MTLFTGAAILEERFVSAYFRFNDDTFAQMQDSLRPSDEAQEFVGQWDSTSRNLAESDALRLLMSFSRFLPVDGKPTSASTPRDPNGAVDRMFHARVEGKKLGAFDVYYDSESAEHLWAGQLRTVEGESYFDVWTSFSAGRSGSQQENLASVDGEEPASDSLRISNYRIRADIRPPRQLDCEARLQVEVHDGGGRTLFFELSRFLQVKLVEADGQPVEFIHNQALEGTRLSRRGNDLVALVFPRPLVAGQKVELRFVYGGEVISEAGGGLLYVGARGTWYPNRGLSMSNFDLEFHYPPDWTLVATGRHLETPPHTPMNPRRHPLPLIRSAVGFRTGQFPSPDSILENTAAQSRMQAVRWLRPTQPASNVDFPKQRRKQ